MLCNFRNDLVEENGPREGRGPRCFMLLLFLPLNKQRYRRAASIETRRVSVFV